MIETVCAKFRKQNHPNNTLLLTWAAFLSQKHLIYLDLILHIYNYRTTGIITPRKSRTEI